MNLNVWLPQIREKWEANSLEIFHRLVDVEDPFVLPLDPQVHGEGDAGLLVTDLHNVMVSLETGQQDNVRAWPGLNGSDLEICGKSEYIDMLIILIIFHFYQTINCESIAITDGKMQHSLLEIRR